MVGLVLWALFLLARNASGFVLGLVAAVDA